MSTIDLSPSTPAEPETAAAATAPASGKRDRITEKDPAAKLARHRPPYGG